MPNITKQERWINEHTTYELAGGRTDGKRLTREPFGRAGLTTPDTNLKHMKGVAGASGEVRRACESVAFESGVQIANGLLVGVYERNAISTRSLGITLFGLNSSSQGSGTNRVQFKCKLRTLFNDLVSLKKRKVPYINFALTVLHTLFCSKT